MAPYVTLLNASESICYDVSNSLKKRFFSLKPQTLSYTQSYLGFAPCSNSASLVSNLMLRNPPKLQMTLLKTVFAIFFHIKSLAEPQIYATVYKFLIFFGFQVNTNIVRMLSFQ